MRVTYPVSKLNLISLLVGLIIATHGMADPAASSRASLSADQKRRAEQLMSYFENGTVVFMYEYGEILGDGRGITVGRAGFTTGTGDAFLVVDRYTKLKPTNPLAKYLPELRRLNSAKNPDDTSGLTGFMEAWKQSAGDPAFCKLQDAVMDELYYYPAMRHAEEVGLSTALARAVMYDTALQHGDGDDPDSLGALMRQTQKQMKGNPDGAVDEKAWLQAFLQNRRADLAQAHDPATRTVWAQSTHRVDVWLQIAASGNYDLHGPIVLPDDQLTIP